MHAPTTAPSGLLLLRDSARKDTKHVMSTYIRGYYEVHVDDAKERTAATARRDIKTKAPLRRRTLSHRVSHTDRRPYYSPDATAPPSSPALPLRPPPRTTSTLCTPPWCRRRGSASRPLQESCRTLSPSPGPSSDRGPSHPRLPPTPYYSPVTCCCLHAAGGPGRCCRSQFGSREEVLPPPPPSLSPYLPAAAAKTRDQVEPMTAQRKRAIEEGGNNARNKKRLQ